MFSYCIFLIAKKGGFPDGLKRNYEVQDFFYRKKVMCVYLRDLCVCYCFIDFLFHHLAMGGEGGGGQLCQSLPVNQKQNPSHKELQL